MFTLLLLWNELGSVWDKGANVLLLCYQLAYRLVHCIPPAVKLQPVGPLTLAKFAIVLAGAVLPLALNYEM